MRPRHAHPPLRSGRRQRRTQASAVVDGGPAVPPSRRSRHIVIAHPRPERLFVRLAIVRARVGQPRCARPGVAVSGGRRPALRHEVRGQQALRNRSMWTPRARAWQAFNIDEDQIARGLRGRNEVADQEVNRQWGARDANVDAGGAIRPGSGVVVPSRPATRRCPCGRSGSRSCPRGRTSPTLGGKATARVTGNSRLVLFGQASRNHQPTRSTAMCARWRPWVGRGLDLGPAGKGGVWKVEWNAYPGQKVYFELLGGQFLADRRRVHERHGSSRREGLGDLSVLGGSRNWEERWRRGADASGGGC